MVAPANNHTLILWEPSEPCMRVRDDAVDELEDCRGLRAARGVEVSIVWNYVGHGVGHGVEGQRATVDPIIPRHVLRAANACLERVRRHRAQIAVRGVELFGRSDF